MRLSDWSSKNIPLNQRDHNEEVRRILNNGLYEVKVIATESPGWVETVSGIPVYSTYGAGGRLYISDMTVDNKWTYVATQAL